MMFHLSRVDIILKTHSYRFEVRVKLLIHNRIMKITQGYGWGIIELTGNKKNLELTKTVNYSGLYFIVLLI